MWKHSSPGGWYFVSLPRLISKEIRENLKWQEEGWGRMRAHAKIGNFKWETAIWFDTKEETYLLMSKPKLERKPTLKSTKKLK